MADPAIIVATIAAVPAILGGTMGAYAGIKQRGNENLQLVITAIESHMSTLAAENTDLRNRVTIAEQKAIEVLLKLADCETERHELQRRLDILERHLELSKLEG